MEAAEVVCAGEPVEDWEVLDLLTALVDKSLVAAEPAGDGTRYRFLETVRQYGGDRLGESGELEAVRGRAAACFLALAEEATRNMKGAGQKASLAQMEMEHDNLRAALAWSETESPHDPAAQHQYLRLGTAAWNFWHRRGHLVEGRRHLVQALEKAPFFVPKDFLVPRDPVTAEDLSRARLRTELLQGAGNIVQTQGDCDAAEAFYKESLVINRYVGDEYGIADAIGSLGNIASDRNDYGSAKALYSETLDLARKTQNKERIAWALSSLAGVAVDCGDFAGVQPLYQESLALYREMEERGSIAWVLGDLGSLYYDQGNYAAAHAPYLEGLALSRELGIKPRIAVFLSGLGSLALAEARPQRALVLWGAAQALRDSISVVVPLRQRTLVGERVAQARTLIGETSSQTAWAEGQAMTWSQAVEYALASNPAF